jgi:hypothetical protein
MFQGNLPRTVAKSPLKATDERFPLDHTRKPHRSPYVRPSRAFRCKQYAAGLKGWGQIGVEKVQGVEIVQL